MKVIIIGESGHGKDTLSEVIKRLADLECEVLDTKDLIEINTKQQIELEDVEINLILDVVEQKCKDKDNKTWKKTKFYER